MLKTRPFISVIIPCFNCTNWIKRCLNSLINQTYSNLEIICVDDASSDTTYHVIKELSVKSNIKIRLFKNQENLGPAYSRNFGIRMSKGDWIAFCDADDYYEKTFIHEMVKSALGENADIVMCEYKKVYENSSKEVVVNYLSNVNSSFTHGDKIAISKASLCLLLIKRDLALKIEIPNLRNGEDIAYIPCIESLANSISIVKQPLYNYTMRRNSASNSLSVDVYKSLNNAFLYVEKNFSSNYPEVLEYIGIRTVLYGVTINALKTGASSEEIKNIVTNFIYKYPNWINNKYIQNLSLVKIFYLWALKFEMYNLCKTMAYIHSKLSI